MLAHRWAYETFVSPLGVLYACHKCDSPSCVNPEHLFAGTDADTHTDKAKKLRAGKVLTPESVRTIRVMIDKKAMTMQRIADAFGCSYKTIQRIKTNTYWRYA